MFSIFLSFAPASRPGGGAGNPTDLGCFRTA